MSDLDDTFGPGTTDRLRDVARLCARAELLAARGRDWYDSDPELEVPKLAADSLVLKLGEAVRRLPQAFLAERGDDPAWRRAIGMRRRLAHDYDAVDYDLVWGVVATHAATLRARVEALLAGADRAGIAPATMGPMGHARIEFFPDHRSAPRSRRRPLLPDGVMFGHIEVVPALAMPLFAWGISLAATLAFRGLRAPVGSPA